jgi:predicted metalloprotease
VQNLIGTMGKVQSQRQRMSERQYNRLSVRLELQADCYAGIWARQSQSEVAVRDLARLDVLRGTERKELEVEIGEAAA